MERPIEACEFAPLALIVMGVSGCGKTTVGAGLAKQLDCSFLEGDDFHDQAAIAKMSRGEPLSDDDRWPWLDRLGAAMRAAVSTGGVAVAACSALKRSYRDRLIAATRVPTRFVLLDVPHDQLARRLSERPDHYMPVSLLASQLATLERPGADEPAMALDASAPPEALCRSTIAWLRQTMPAVQEARR